MCDYGAPSRRLRRCEQPGMMRAMTNWETGRSVAIDPETVAAVASREDFVRLVEAMHADLVGSCATEWENNSLERFIEALAAFAGSLDSYWQNRGEGISQQPTWATFALLLTAATGYE